MADAFAVRIAGTGIVTALGAGVAGTVDRIRAGKAGLVRPSLVPTPLAGRVWVGQVPDGIVDPAEPRTDALAIAAAREALADAGLAGGDLADLALVVGTVSGTNWELEARYRGELEAAGALVPCLRIEPGPGRVTERLARRLGIGGVRLTCGSACTSSANAALVAMELLRSGAARRALVVGCDVVGATMLHGFDALMLLDPRGCRPFDATRAGITLGEGAAALVLQADAGERDGRPRLLGGANRCDPHHMTASAPDGSGAEAVMREACRRADVDPAGIAAVKAHGTGTKDNDLTEGRALVRLYGDAVPPFASMKPYFGHPMGAAGAVEIVAYLACVGAGFLPAEPGFEAVDPDLGLAPLTAHRDAGPGLYLLNWFGFGGNSTSIVARVPAPGEAA